jgi:predicted phosphodiesterase
LRDALAPQVVVLSGDITQRATRVQFAAARAFVDRLAVPSMRTVLAIPGNHDIPLFQLGARCFSPYGRYKEAFGDDLEPVFESADWLVVTVNTTRWYRHEDGVVSPAQVERVAAAAGGRLALAAARGGDAPAGDGHAQEDMSNRLHGRERAVARWSEAGVDLILGGHIHLPYVRSLHDAFSGCKRTAFAVQAGTAVSSRARRLSEFGERGAARHGRRHARLPRGTLGLRGRRAKPSSAPKYSRFRLPAVRRPLRVLPHAIGSLPSRLVLLAQQLGAHALGWFLSIWTVSVLGVGAVCWTLQRRHFKALDADEPSEPRIALRAGGGFPADPGGGERVRVDRLEPVGRPLDGPGRPGAGRCHRHPRAVGGARRVQLAHPPGRRRVSCAGVPRWSRSCCGAMRTTAWRFGWVLALGGIVVLNPALKHIFERARPVHDHRLAMETSFSFPSGHSAGAIVSYGMLLYLALRTLPARWHVPAAMAAVAAILTIACSRIFLQVHFASDVAAGLLTGLAWLLVCVGSLEYARHRKRRTAR